MNENNKNSLEEICFLWDRMHVLCSKECDGHDKACKRYVKSKPYKHPEKYFNKIWRGEKE